MGGGQGGGGWGRGRWRAGPRPDEVACVGRGSPSRRGSALPGSPLLVGSTLVGFHPSLFGSRPRILENLRQRTPLLGLSVQFHGAKAFKVPRRSSTFPVIASARCRAPSRDSCFRALPVGLRPPAIVSPPHLGRPASRRGSRRSWWQQPRLTLGGAADSAHSLRVVDCPPPLLACARARPLAAASVGSTARRRRGWPVRTRAHHPHGRWRQRDCQRGRATAGGRRAPWHPPLPRRGPPSLSLPATPLSCPPVPFLPAPPPALLLWYR